MSDADMGGFSSSSVEFKNSDETNPAHIRFFGSISPELPPDRINLKAAGYAGFRTHDRKRTLFNSNMWDIEQYRFLAVRLKTDGRKYFINLQTDGIEPTDLHQHRVYSKRPGQWETILIEFDEFVRTNHGRLVEPQSEILKQQINSVGFSLIDRIPGPFELKVQRVWASNGLDLEDEARREKEDPVSKLDVYT